MLVIVERKIVNVEGHVCGCNRDPGRFHWCFSQDLCLVSMKLGFFITFHMFLSNLSFFLQLLCLMLLSHVVNLMIVLV